MRMKRFLYFVISMVMILPIISISFKPIKVIADEAYLWPAKGTQKINQYYSSSHDGLDIGGSLDTPILATMSGTVVAVIDGDVPNKWIGYGKGVVIKHSNGYYSHYAHMNYTSVSVDQYVSQGHQIGGMGTTGNSTGVHLHFAVATSMYGAGGRINVNPDVINYIFDIHTHNYSYKSTVTKQPTCTENGIRTNTCSCGESKTESIPATGHTYSKKEVYPTLESEGYTIYTCTKCGDTYKGNSVPPIEMGEDGWYYSDMLPSDITDSDYEIQYKHSYKKKATSSPGSDWIKGDLASSGYENVGDAFTTAKKVDTSDTLVMTNYFYYHYCGGSAGTEANYEQTSKFVHYDYIYPEYSVVVKSTGMDGEFPYFVLGWANDNSTVFCSSGTTCDGSAGSHGERSKAWYRMATYQNRKFVSYYNYTKETDWITKKDSNATTIKYRYRPINNTVIGDVNSDGEFTVADVVLLQHWLLAVPDAELANWQAADLCEDGKLDVFDLVMMKRKLINS